MSGRMMRQQACGSPESRRSVLHSAQRLGITNKKEIGGKRERDKKERMGNYERALCVVIV